jgi:hypothetical protein
VPPAVPHPARPTAEHHPAGPRSRLSSGRPDDHSS